MWVCVKLPCLCDCHHKQCPPCTPCTLGYTRAPPPTTTSDRSTTYQRSEVNHKQYSLEREDAYLVFLIKPAHSWGHLVNDSDLGGQLVLDQVSRQMATHKPDTCTTNGHIIISTITATLLYHNSDTLMSLHTLTSCSCSTYIQQH